MIDGDADLRKIHQTARLWRLSGHHLHESSSETLVESSEGLYLTGAINWGQFEDKSYL